MKYIIILLLLFKCSTSNGQTASLDSLLTLYKMDSIQLKNYCKTPHISYFIYYDTEEYDMVLYVNDSISIYSFFCGFPYDRTKDTIHSLSYAIHDKVEYEKIKQLVISRGYKNAYTTKENESYELGSINITFLYVNRKYMLAISNDVLNKEE